MSSGATETEVTGAITTVYLIRDTDKKHLRALDIADDHDKTLTYLAFRDELPEAIADAQFEIRNGAGRARIRCAGRGQKWWKLSRSSADNWVLVQPDLLSSDDSKFIIKPDPSTEDDTFRSVGNNLYCVSSTKGPVEDCLIASGHTLVEAVILKELPV